MEVTLKIESGLVNKIMLRVEEKGVAKTLTWLIRKILKEIQVSFMNPRKCYVLEKDLTTHFPFLRSKLDATYKIACFENLESFKEIRKPWKVWSRKFGKRFKRGQTCIACFRNNQVIGYIWITFVPEKDNNLGLTVKPKENESYGFDLYVLPEYRKFLIGFELISRWLKYSRECGKQNVIGVVEKFNKPMWMTMKLAFGFKIVKRFHSLEFFKFHGIIIRNKKVI